MIEVREQLHLFESSFHFFSDQVNTFLDDISFYVGASCWEAGQLESEVKQGIWLPCRGPPEMALTGTCDHVGDDEIYTKEAERPKADLWLSLMCAMGNDEATLAHLLSADDNNENDDACDNF